MEQQINLFSGEPEVYGEKAVLFKIKRFDDANFDLDIRVSREQDSHEEALSKLGYFIIPETV